MATSLEVLIPAVPSPVAASGPLAAMEKLVTMTLATCASPNTRRVYATYITTFLEAQLPLNREGVAMHLQCLREAGQGISSLTGNLAAIKKLAYEAEIRGLLSYEQYAQIKALNAGKYQANKRGQWLTIAQVRTLLSLPDRTTYWGKRDACLLSLLVGCGFRRAELASLKWTHYQSREDRMVILDVTGKGNRVRTVPVPTWAQPDVDAWKAVCASPPEPTTREEICQHARRSYDATLITGGIGYEAIADLVELYSQKLGVQITAHDLRRTLAQLLRKSGAPLEQIQMTLGHQNLATTQIYLGSMLELGRGAAAVDQLKLGGDR